MSSTSAMAQEPAVTDLQLVPMQKLSDAVGIKVSSSQWRKWVKNDNLPHIEIGQTRFFNPSAVKRWLNAKACGIPYTEIAPSC